MFTNTKAKYYGDNKVLLDSACLSTDTKPTTGVANGSKCIEMDTGKTYMFNEEDSEWEELPSSGGGGGSSDFSTAECTIVASSPISIIAPCITPYGINGNIFSEDITGKLTVVLYQDNSKVWSADAEVVSVSGNAEIDDGMAVITGDCTITFE